MKKIQYNNIIVNNTIIKRILASSVIIFIACAFMLSLTSSKVYAEPAPAKNSQQSNSKNSQQAPEPVSNADRDEIRDCGTKKSAAECLKENPLVKWIEYAINFLSAGIGIIVVIMIIIGGIQYASAGSNPQAVQAAKKKISNALIALVAYFFLFAFLQYLMPGGIF